MINLYQISNLEKQIEIIAQSHEGEIPDELLQELVNQQTKSLVHIENLCQYIKTIEYKIDACKKEENRINELRVKAEKHVDRIKSYLTPYIKQQGKIETNTFTLTTRKSESVEIIDDKQIPIAYMHEIPIQLKPDKAMIKKDLKAGKAVPGAELKENDNLQIK